MTTRMQDRLAAYRTGAPLVFPAMERVHACVKGVPVVFNLNMTRDPIQNRHRRGMFYESDELAVVGDLLPDDALILDIGANVGNHAVWFAQHGRASRVVVIEPNPLSLEPLVANVVANGLEGIIDLDFIGFGLSDANAGGFLMKAHDRNLGATKMFADQDGDLEVRRGDDVFPTLMPHFVKIDVEGMEMKVLRGLIALIARARPILMVEVEEANIAALADWIETHSYDEYRAFGVGETVANHILVPQRA